MWSRVYALGWVLVYFGAMVFLEKRKLCPQQIQVQGVKTHFAHLIFALVFGRACVRVCVNDLHVLPCKHAHTNACWRRPMHPFHFDPCVAIASVKKFPLKNAHFTARWVNQRTWKLFTQLSDQRLIWRARFACYFCTHPRNNKFVGCNLQRANSVSWLVSFAMAIALRFASFFL